MKPLDPGAGGPPLMAEINVTPFIDVMLVLLIIFMVAAPLMVAGVPLALPRTRTAPVPPSKEPVVISMDKDGRVFLGDVPVDDADLPARLTALTRADPGRAVYVRCDRQLDYGRVMDLLGRVGAGGVGNLALLTDSRTGPEGQGGRP